MGLPIMQVRRAIWIDREKALDWLAQFEKRAHKNAAADQQVEEA
jgi:hypothetical protein